MQAVSSEMTLLSVLDVEECFLMGWACFLRAELNDSGNP
jgi:hypothetical protein